MWWKSARRSAKDFSLRASSSSQALYRNPIMRHRLQRFEHLAKHVAVAHLRIQLLPRDERVLVHPLERELHGEGGLAGAFGLQVARGEVAQSLDLLQGFDELRRGHPVGELDAVPLREPVQDRLVDGLVRR